MKLISLFMVMLLAGCGGMNPLAASIERRIVKDGPSCHIHPISQEEICYTTDEKLQLYADQRIWTKTEKALLAGTWACQVADIVTTDMILSDGGSEMNPIYGSNPSIPLLSVVKGSLTLAMTVVADAKPISRKSMLLGYGGVSCAVVGWNAGQLAK